MKRYSLLIVLIVFGFATAFAQAPQNVEVPASKISGGQVSIIGLLGKRFGEKITITGKLASRPIKMSNPFDVSKIDGKPVEKPILIEIEGLKIKPGTDYTLVGYETGGYNSTPDWASAD